MAKPNAILVYKTSLARALTHIRVAEKFGARLSTRCALPIEKVEQMAACITAAREILEAIYGKQNERKDSAAPDTRQSAL